MTRNIIDELREAIQQGDTFRLRSLLRKRKDVANTPPLSPEHNDGNLLHFLADHAQRLEEESLSVLCENGSVAAGKGKESNAPSEYKERSKISSLKEWDLSELDNELLLSIQNFEYNVQLPWKCLPRKIPNADDDLRKTIVYILVEEGEDVNDTDQYGRTPLYIACYQGDSVLCDVLLQCGADPNFIAGAQPIISHAAQFAIAEELRDSRNTNLSKKYSVQYKKFGPARSAFEICRFYWPGLWNSVEIQSIERVRRLLNSWCRVNLTREGQTLIDLALSIGNEAIISLLLNISSTMDVIYKALAKDRNSLLKVIENPAAGKINLNMRKMSEFGAPLLYYLIQAGEVVLVEDLVQIGASPFVLMQDCHETDMPVIFTVIHKEAKPDMIKALLTSSGGKCLPLDLIWYKGKTILQDAVEKRIPDEAILAILEVGGPCLLADRNPSGNTIMDELLMQGNRDLVAIIDNLVFRWIAQPETYPGWRETLTLRGFDRFNIIAKNSSSCSSADEHMMRFLKEAELCQSFIEDLFEDVQLGIIDSFVSPDYSFSSASFHVNDVLWHGRLKGDGMPLLHWVVLHNSVAILDIILSQLFETTDPKNQITKRYNIDEVRDQWRRTPLHYAYGLTDGAPIKKLLSSTGATEHTLDMFEKEPLDFRDACESQEMEFLLENLRKKNYKLDQEEPWRPEVLRSHLREKWKQRIDHELRSPRHIHHHHLQQYHHLCHYDHYPYLDFFQPNHSRHLQKLLDPRNASFYRREKALPLSYEPAYNSSANRPTMVSSASEAQLLQIHQIHRGNCFFPNSSALQPIVHASSGNINNPANMGLFHYSSPTCCHPETDKKDAGYKFCLIM